MLARFLPGFSVTATTLCGFAISVVIDGQERRRAWQRLSTVAIQTGYRLLARLGQAQPHLRAWLCRLRAPPPSCAQAPLSQLLAHLQLALPGAGCILARVFFVEQDRTVLADNTFSLRRVRFEAPRDLRSRKVQVRFDRGCNDPHGLSRAVVFYKGERMGEAKPVDFIGNDRKPSPASQRSASRGARNDSCPLWP